MSHQKGKKFHRADFQEGLKHSLVLIYTLYRYQFSKSHKVHFNRSGQFQLVQYSSGFISFVNFSTYFVGGFLDLCAEKVILYFLTHQVFCWFLPRRDPVDTGQLDKKLNSLVWCDRRQHLPTLRWVYATHYDVFILHSAIHRPRWMGWGSWCVFNQTGSSHLNY